jgi:hypothetical protein
MNTGGNTIALKSIQSLQNTEHLATLMKAHSFTTQKACIDCYILSELWHRVSDRGYFLYVSLQCHKNVSGHEMADFSSDASFMNTKFIWKRHPILQLCTH